PLRPLRTCRSTGLNRSTDDEVIGEALNSLQVQGQATQGRFHQPRLLSDKILPLAVRPPRVLLLDRRDRYHAAKAPSQKRTGGASRRATRGGSLRDVQLLAGHRSIVSGSLIPLL